MKTISYSQLSEDNKKRADKMHIDGQFVVAYYSGKYGTLRVVQDWHAKRTTTKNLLRIDFDN